MSLNIYDSSGEVIRELLHAAPRKLGDNVEIWDGQDDDGNPVPAGTYTWRMLKTQGLHTDYLLTVGSNYAYGKNYWEAGPGTHYGGGWSVAVDDTGMYVSALVSENQTPIRKQSLDGKTVIWSAKEPELWQGGASMSCSGDTLYMLTGNGKIWRYDSQLGEKDDGIKTPYRSGEAPFFWNVRWEGDEKYDYDMDVYGDTLVVSYAAYNAIRWYDIQSGTILDTVEVSAPQGVTVGSNGVVYVISGTKVVRISREQKNPVDFITGLVSPYRIDVDHSTEDILVVERGVSQQIKRYSSNGVLLKTYGQYGGRHDGLYTEEMQKSFYQLTDIAADGKGGFLVCEPLTAPRRTAHFNYEGNLINEWYGGQSWGTFLMNDPDDPSVVWVSSHKGTMMRTLIDYKNKTWKIHSTYTLDGLANGMINPTYGMMADRWFIRKHNGNTYFIWSVESNAFLIIVKLDESNWSLKPVVYGAENIQFHNQTIIDYITKEKKAWHFIWTDQNGDGVFIADDGVMQENEMRFEKERILDGGVIFVDENFDYYLFRNESKSIWRYYVNNWNKCGAPEYTNYPYPERVVDFPDRAKPPADLAWATYLCQNPSSGDFYAAFNNEPGWGTSTDSFFTKWDSQWNYIWTVGKKGKRPGMIWDDLGGTFRHFVGITHDCNIINAFNNPRRNMSYIWDKDGLWVGGYFDNPNFRTDIPNHLYQLSSDNLTGEIYTDPTTGNVLLFGAIENEGRIFSITGWDAFERSNGTIQVEVPSNANGTGLRADYFDDNQFTHHLKAQLDSSVDFEWKENPAIAPNVPSANMFSVRWYGTLQPDFSENYTLYAETDGLMKLIVDGVSIIDASTESSAIREFSGEIKLEKNQKYEIQVEYSNTDSTGGAAKLYWSSPSVQKQIIPRKNLYPDPITTEVLAGSGVGFKAEYFDDIGFKPEDLIASRIDPYIDFDWYSSYPDPRINSNVYSVRWSGQLEPRQTGYHYFAAFVGTWNVKSGKLTIDGHEFGLMQEWFRYMIYSDPIWLTAGKKVDIKLESEWAGWGNRPLLLWNEPYGRDQHGKKASSTEGMEMLLREQYTGLDGLLIPSSQIYPTYSGNSLPRVAITAPSQDTPFDYHSNISIQVEASDLDGQIDRVELYQNGTLLTQLNSSPYRYDWSGVSSGIYQVSARAYDNSGACNDSKPVSVVVRSEIPPTPTLRPTSTPTRTPTPTPGEIFYYNDFNNPSSAIPSKAWPEWIDFGGNTAKSVNNRIEWYDSIGNDDWLRLNMQLPSIFAMEFDFFYQQNITGRFSVWPLVNPGENIFDRDNYFLRENTHYFNGTDVIPTEGKRDLSLPLGSNPHRVRFEVNGDHVAFRYRNRGDGDWILVDERDFPAFGISHRYIQLGYNHDGGTGGVHWIDNFIIYNRFLVPTSTPIIKSTSTPTRIPTVAPTATSIIMPTATSTPSLPNTPTNTSTPSFTPTFTHTPSPSHTPTFTPSPTPIPILTRWEFNTDNDLEGWQGSGIANLAVSGGILTGAAETNDPLIQKMGINVQTRYISGIAVRFRANQASALQVFIATMDDEWKFQYIQDLPYSENGEFQTYVIPLALNGDENQVLDLLRIDPAVNPGVQFEIDWIGLISSGVLQPTPTFTPMPAPTPTYSPTPKPVGVPGWELY